MKNTILSSKLEYLGLDLDKIPKNLKSSEEIKLQTLDNLEQRNYKVYRYLKIKDIKILLTPTNRLTETTIKYSRANSLSYYLNKENIDYYEKFIDIVMKTDEKEIKNLMNMQKALNKQIPTKVKFTKDYLWQIYYEENLKQYFMLVPTEETEFSAFLYVLKKQLEKSKDEIFVPICNVNYSKTLLKYKEINDLENYLYYFTKNWPMIYEVYDKDDNCTLEIVGKASIYSTIKTDYKIVLKDKEEAVQKYKLIKALFMLQTGLPYYFKFDIQLDETGNIHFLKNNEEISYESLKSFVKKEYEEAKEGILKVEDLRIELEEILENLSEEEKRLYGEFLLKQKQISTFLECKKTFFGKIKYFFKYSKKNKVPEKIEQEQNKVENKIEKYTEPEILQETPTVDSLISICNILISKTNEANLKKLDIEKLKVKVAILKKKIENADLYIKEIESHKKSIFDFWKFTNKDESNQLAEGYNNAVETLKIKKSFDLETDFEEIAQSIDSKERKNLTKEELNSVFLTTTNILEDLNLLLLDKEIPEKHLEILKDEYKENGFDVLDVEHDNELTKNKHRESKRNKFALLDITEDTTLAEYRTILEKVLKNIERAFSKINLNLDIPIYMVGKKKVEKDLEIFHINPTKILPSKTGVVNLHRIDINNKTKALGLSNIVFYNNTNKTLPLGMDYSTGMVINLKDTKLEIKNTKTNYILTFEEDSNKISAIKLNIFEYDL